MKPNKVKLEINASTPDEIQHALTFINDEKNNRYVKVKHTVTPKEMYISGPEKAVYDLLLALQKSLLITDPQNICPSIKDYLPYTNIPNSMLKIPFDEMVNVSLISGKQNQNYQIDFLYADIINRCSEGGRLYEYIIKSGIKFEHTIQSISLSLVGDENEVKQLEEKYKKISGSGLTGPRFFKSLSKPEVVSPSTLTRRAHRKSFSQN